MKYQKFTLPIALALALLVPAGLHAAAVFDPAKQPYGQLPSLALTGFNLSGGTQKTYQAWFDGWSWSGDVVGYPLGADGRTQVAERLWSAAEVFQSKQGCGTATDEVTASTTWFDFDRVVVTRNRDTNANKPFRWSSIGPTNQAAIGDATNGPKILNFVRGDRSNEKENIVAEGDYDPVTNPDPALIQYECGSASGAFRARNSILGDIIHARPVYVAGPPADYLFDDYQAFKTSKASRPGRVYIGANDGMVHAFNADTGEEVWAYVPSMVIPNLKALAADPYTHTYFIDGGMIAADVNLGTTTPSWKTVLVGGLGAGGKGLFALDVTDTLNPSDPATLKEFVAQNKILWEIDASQYPSTNPLASLGHSYAEPIIARLNTGQWAVIVGNGYNNTVTGTAWLYIIDIKTGNLIKAINTGSGSVASPNGLSTPTAIDVNFDGKVDRVYAGDIDGHLWKFDLAGTSTSSWDVAGSGPLFDTGGRAIIGAPDIAAHPLNGYLVYFGSGRLFTAADATDGTTVNYAYGIWDGAPAANTVILQQTLTEKNYGSLRVRVTGGKSINWSPANDADGNPLPLHRGWRTPLPAGERIIGAGFVRDARYHFTSVNPTITNSQPPNGENWLNELDYLTGAVGTKLIYDLNADSKLTDGDRVQLANGDPVAGPAGIPVSVFQGTGLLSQPVLAILSAQLSTTIFNDNPYFSPADAPTTPPPPTIVSDRGVSGGHFDVDLYKKTGDKLKHTHQYDDIYNVTGVNFLAPSDPSFDIKTVVSGVNEKFKVLIANQKMSPAVNFSYGGLPYENVLDIPQFNTAGLSLASLPVYTRETIQTLKYYMPRDAFEVKDWAGDGNLVVGLMPTQTGCVNSDKAGGSKQTGLPGPAPHSLRRNGAFTVLLVKDTTPDSAIVLASAAGDPAYGYVVKADVWSTYVVAEWTVFWHHQENGKCWGQAGWVPDPPQDTSPPDPKKWKTPGPNSSDPPYDSFGAKTSVTTTEIDDPDQASKDFTIRITETQYASGAKIIVTEYLKKNKVQRTVVTVVPPSTGGSSPPGGGMGGNGVSQSLSVANTITGFQQTRNSGKLGRFGWRELFAP